jgi:hypothetical protein
MQSRFKWAAIAVVSLTALAACDDPGDDFSPPQSFTLRAIHAVADAPAVDVEVGGLPIATDLEFKQATRNIGYPVGRDTAVRVDGVVPGGTVTVIGPVEVDFEADMEYAIIALGSLAAIEPLILERTATDIAAGSVRAEVVHAAASAPQVDVYVTAPDADLLQAEPLGSFAFKETLGPVDVPAAEYQIRVTLPGDPASVVFDSGTVALPAAADLLILAVDNTGPGPAPISLIVSDASGSFEILDRATPSGYRVIHASPDAPPVDVYVDGALVLESVPFPAFSDFSYVPPGGYELVVTAENNPGAIVIEESIELEAGTEVSLYAAGPLAAIEPYVLEDDRRSVATEARVRIVHLSPSAGPVDIYVTAPGTAIETIDPAFASVEFKAETGYVSLPGADYEVTVTVVGTKTAAIGPAAITVADGGVYTAVARDAPADAPPFGLILLDDFN